MITARNLLLSFTVLMMLVPFTSGQGLSNDEKSRGKQMLKAFKDDIRKFYYDPNFHGMDLDQRFSLAEKKIDDSQSLGQMFGVIAQVLLDLDDSHTFFIPPSRVTRTEYGLQMMMVGDQCYVKSVKPGSDAESKGLKPGDKILTVGGYAPTREILWKMIYSFYTIRPKPSLPFVIEDPNGVQKKIDVLAKVTQGKLVTDLTASDGGDDINNIIRDAETESRLRASRITEYGNDLFIWNLPDFSRPESHIDDVMGKAHDHKAMIIDLRGNPGGRVVTLERLIGNVFDHDVTIATQKGRKESKPMLAKSRGDHAFKGKLIVLVDAQSASAAEIFARVVQLEKRGTVIGDVTSGKVMESQVEDHKMGTDTVVFYSASITRCDLIMADGKSLEKVGVTPDERILPTASDMAAKRDPVLSHAAELAGVKLSSEKAGSLFPTEWKK